MVKPDWELASAVLKGLLNLAKKRRISGIIDGTHNTIEAFCLSNPLGKKLAYLIVESFLSIGPGVTAASRFLPQGAPTSPFLSNLMMKIVDIRLEAMAKAFGGFYTRYADDLTVSWVARAQGKTIDGMYRCANEVLQEYGILLNRRKKKVMGMGVRQDIVGYCVNSGTPTISQRYRKNIRAAIHNEVVHGSANFRNGKRQPAFSGEAYDNTGPSLLRQQEIQGRISYIQVAHPDEAARYRERMQYVAYGSNRSLFTETPQQHEIELSVSQKIDAQGINEGLIEFDLHPRDLLG